MKIAIGSDHAGFELKEEIKNHLISGGYDCDDYGTFSSERTHYPLYAEKVAHAVASGKAEKGILVCGTGVGISIAANKVHGIRCVVCSEPYSAKLSRNHNDTNIIAMGSRVVGSELAKMIVDIWLKSEFENDRHFERVKMIKKLEEGQSLS